MHRRNAPPSLTLVKMEVHNEDVKIKVEDYIKQEKVYYPPEFILQGLTNRSGKNGKPYVCPVPGCPKAYKNPNGIKYHAQYGHSATQHYICECGKIYTTRHGLMAHKKAHQTPEERLQRSRRAKNDTPKAPKGRTTVNSRSSVGNLQSLSKKTVHQNEAETEMKMCVKLNDHRYAMDVDDTEYYGPFSNIKQETDCELYLNTEQEKDFVFSRNIKQEDFGLCRHIKQEEDYGHCRNIKQEESSPISSFKISSPAPSPSSDDRSCNPDPFPTDSKIGNWHPNFQYDTFDFGVSVSSPPTQKNTEEIKQEKEIKQENTYYSPEFILQGLAKRSSKSGKSFVCPVPGCPKIYKNPNGLKYHAQYGHSEPQQYGCECGKVYTTRHGLMAHKKIHQTPEERLQRTRRPKIDTPTAPKAPKARTTFNSRSSVWSGQSVSKKSVRQNNAETEVKMCIELLDHPYAMDIGGRSEGYGLCRNIKQEEDSSLVRISSPAPSVHPSPSEDDSRSDSLCSESKGYWHTNFHYNTFDFDVSMFCNSATSLPTQENANIAKICDYGSCHDFFTTEEEYKHHITMMHPGGSNRQEYFERVLLEIMTPDSVDLGNIFNNGCTI